MTHDNTLSELGFEIVTHPNLPKEIGFIKNVDGVIHRIYFDGDTINFAGFDEDQEFGTLSYWDEKYSLYSFWLDNKVVNKEELTTVIKLLAKSYGNTSL